jgi:hypothetical protein
MSNNYEEIVGTALTLPPAAKAMLAEHLLADTGCLPNSMRFRRLRSASRRPTGRGGRKPSL